MCSIGGGSPPPPPPESEENKQRRKQMRANEQQDREVQKEEDLQRRIASFYGTRSRNSLLSAAARGGSGFKLDSSLMSKDKLGA
jgi:hypothetical protein